MDPVVSAQTATGGTIAARLADARARGFVGRDAELDLLRELLDEDPPSAAVVFFHGPGGIGKSALLRCVATEAERRGRITALVDGRSGSGGPAAFTSALGAALGLPADADPVSALHAGPPALLLLDTFDQLDPLGSWLRERFLPELPAPTLTVVGSRQPPGPEWSTDPGWRDLSRSVALRNLPPADARRFLDARGVGPDEVDALLGVTGGYPLALTLLAEVVEQGGSVPNWLQDVPDIVHALLQRFLEDVPTPAHREALEISAHALTTTSELLQACVADADPDELFSWLRARPFMESVPGGLVPHDVARDVLEADLRWRDETRFREVHRKVRAHVISRMRSSEGQPRRDAFEGLMYLHRSNPFYAAYTTWKGGSLLPRTATDVDMDAIARMTAEHGMPDTATLMRTWARHPTARLMTYRPPGASRPAGYSLFVDLPVDPEAASTHGDVPIDDPVVRAVADHLAVTAPLRADEYALISRMVLSAEDGMEPSPVMDAYELELVARSIAGPNPPAWTVCAIPHPEADVWDPLLTYIDWPRLPAPLVEFDGRAWSLFGHDWRRTPPAVWLELMGDREIADDIDIDALRAAARPRTVVLSRQEFDDAVRAALRCVRRPEQLRGSPLLRSRLVLDRDPSDPIATLTGLIEEATDALRDHRGGDKWHRAVATTVFKGAPTQEAAAERLGLPFSTYRRHLTSGIAAVSDHLWERELHGTDGADPQR